MVDTTGSPPSHGFQPPSNMPDIVVLYAHDEIGNSTRAAIVAELRRLGFTVHCDRDLNIKAALSFKERIIQHIETDLVVCILSPDFVEWFGTFDDSPQRRGVRFERHYIVEKMSRHTGSGPWPVLLVAPPDLPLDNLPLTLTIPSIIKYRPATSDINAVAEQLVFAATSLTDDTGNDAPQSSTSDTPQSPSPSTSNDDENHPQQRDTSTVIRDLWEVDPSAPQAVCLVEELLRVAEHAGRSADIAYIFPVAEKIARRAGNDELMENLVHTCERALGTSTLLGDDALFVAGMLISGLAWAYSHRRDNARALAATQRAIHLATRHPGGRLIVAGGHRALGYLHRVLAEDPTTPDTTHHLEMSKKTATAAYRALRRWGQSTNTVGQALHVRALAYFTDFQLTGHWTSHWRACVLARRTAENYPATSANEQLARLLLRAEIALAAGDISLTSTLLNQLDDLVDLRKAERDGGPGADITARLRLVRAELFYQRGTGSTVHMAEDAEAALKIFDEMSMPLRAATVRWLLIKLDHSAHHLTEDDIRTLESLTRNPFDRINAVAEHARRRQQRTQRRRPTAHWRTILRFVRRHDLPEPPALAPGWTDTPPN
ncbi:hypothetical protein ACFQ1S_00030 [Kibdelosporangium lantanae]|uniref:TIR domain-containing protein n=1 Tax=Kibdelosporangium lantanae TaxID=1497396 RepID=A0ABW3M288_9PSEU